MIRQRVNVLIVDDEKYLAEIWKEIFDMLGCHVYVADSVDHGISILGQQKIQLVITDLRMPEADGYVLLDYLAGSNFGDREIDIFVCSGFHEDNRTKLEQSDIVRIIPKPFSVMEELSYFRDFLSKRY